MKSSSFQTNLGGAASSHHFLFNYLFCSDTAIVLEGHGNVEVLWVSQHIVTTMQTSRLMYHTLQHTFGLVGND